VRLLLFRPRHAGRGALSLRRLARAGRPGSTRSGNIAPKRAEGLCDHRKGDSGNVGVSTLVPRDDARGWRAPSAPIHAHRKTGAWPPVYGAQG